MWMSKNMAEVIVGYVVRGARSGDCGWQTTNRHRLARDLVDIRSQES